MPVLDTSAVLALLLNEPGAQKVKAVLHGALFCTVNLAEIVSCYAKLGISRPRIHAIVRPLPIRLIQPDEDLSFEAGMLRPITLPGGLSLGDRYCLALARRESMPAMTAERKWPRIAQAAGVSVELIR